jgi:hypothetical protein
MPGQINGKAIILRGALEEKPHVSTLLALLHQKGSHLELLPNPYPFLFEGKKLLIHLLLSLCIYMNKMF